MGFDSAFQRTFGFEAQINLRQVAEPQCPVVTALAAQEAQPGGRRPALTLKSDQVRSGGNVVATADARADKAVELFLVSDDGQVHSLSRFTKREGDSLTLTLKLVGSRPEARDGPAARRRPREPAPAHRPARLAEGRQHRCRPVLPSARRRERERPIGIAARYFILSGGS